MAAFHPEEAPPSRHVRSVSDFMTTKRFTGPGNEEDTIYFIAISEQNTAVIQTAKLDKRDNLLKVNGHTLMKWKDFLESPLNELQDYLQETADALQPGKLPFNRKVIQHELNGVFTTLRYNDVYYQQSGRDFSSITTERGAADLSRHMDEAAQPGGGKKRRSRKSNLKTRKSRRKVKL